MHNRPQICHTKSYAWLIKLNSAKVSSQPEVYVMFQSLALQEFYRPWHNVLCVTEWHGRVHATLRLTFVNAEMNDIHFLNGKVCTNGRHAQVDLEFCLENIRSQLFQRLCMPFGTLSQITNLQYFCIHLSIHKSAPQTNRCCHFTAILYIRNT